MRKSTVKKTPVPTEARRKEPAVKHVLRTGLPPGISVADAKDPGSATPAKGPVDNRS